MYLHRLHRFAQPAEMGSLIDDHPLGTWVCADAQGLVANHIPFVLDRQRGPHGTLLGHVARANPVWRTLASPQASVVCFLGPQAYISPGWYPGKAQHGRVVPTWNYAAVHVHGMARAFDDRAALLDLLQRLTGAMENPRPQPWQVKDAPADYLDAMLRAIVGIEIPITRLEGRLKASQDEDHADRIGTVAGLHREGGPWGEAMAGLVRQALDTEP